MVIELKCEGVKNRQYDLEIVPMRYNCAGKNPSLYQSHSSCQSSSFDLDVNPVPPGPPIVIPNAVSQSAGGTRGLSSAYIIRAPHLFSVYYYAVLFTSASWFEAQKVGLWPFRGLVEDYL